ncbi:MULTISPECIES: sugar-binding transcriptional regulator [Halomonas]|uniref:sugar-binding transcriptional regulator n=1 Tax=Halomonas TaxID=2745 RepID=UPI001C96D768|nr:MULTISPECIES: sugar-binding transcriptional regulator [Halomonas]MBY6207528.1 sugar-binding transcriptional regulator [Halomonas sp. DP3Y7-2]MBY6228337.1 sugar-binding transcriptional regulator [Halomonas sp. DP3Y7-1]MCA0916402.1 sugar-binding transcriptional regulator [Halomonas denitrificans]
MKTPPASHTEADLALRAAWLSYVGGYTQAQIAERLQVSRMKVHRLVALAHDMGAVQVFIEGSPAALLQLEDELKRLAGLEDCIVVPSPEHDAIRPEVNLGRAAAHYLKARLEAKQVSTLGLGWGRSLSEMVNCLPTLDCRGVRMVPVLGSVVHKMALNPYDVIHRLVDKTGGEGYLLPVPLFADTVDHRDVLMSQRSVQDVMAIAAQADLTMVGIGAVPDQGHSLLMELGEINAEDAASLRKDGASAEILGRFLSRDGRELDSEINRRTLGLSLAQLRGHRIVAVAGGAQKIEATRAVLASGLLKGLITDEEVARQLVAGLRQDGGET